MNCFHKTVKILQKNDDISVYIKDLEVVPNECYDLEDVFDMNSICLSKNTMLKISLKTKNPETPITMKLPSVKRLIIQSITPQAMEFHSIPRETRCVRLIHINCFFIEGLIKLDKLRTFQYTSNLAFDIKLHYIAKNLEKLSIHADYLIKDTIGNLKNLTSCKITLSYFKKISNIQEIQKLLYVNRNVVLHIHLEEDIYDFTPEKAYEYITPRLNKSRNPSRIFINDIRCDRLEEDALAKQRVKVRNDKPLPSVFVKSRRTKK